jgi:uncharacterized membrane protein YeaQ/YmgE (transglycosylase-associated protein family)
MNLIGWIILGGLAGWIASRIMGTSKRQGCLMDIAVGIAGAFIGGFIFSLFGATGVQGFDPRSLLVAVVGAVVLLWLVKTFRR